MVSRDMRHSDVVFKSSRRRKKKRTAEVSDSSDSPELSSDEGSQISEKDLLEESEPYSQPSANENLKHVHEVLSEDTIESLSKIPFTRTEPNGKSTGHGDDMTMDLERVNESIKEARQKVYESKEDRVQSTARLKNSYLELLFESYGDDISSLKNAPDFTSDSLVMIAQVLKDGSCMFDMETLKAMLESK